MTPVGVWVVETKSNWVSKRRFPPALRQVAQNVDRVRSHLETSLPVRGALVIADRSNDSLEADYDWNGKPIKVFGAKKFWNVLCVEREHSPAIERPDERARVERLIWNLGSKRPLDS